MRRSGCLLCLLLLSSVSVAPSTEKTAAQLIASAKAGDAEAQTSLGDRLAFGEGQHDFAEAAKWYRAAADQGATALTAGVLTCRQRLG